MHLQPTVNITVNSVPSGIFIDEEHTLGYFKHYLIIEFSLTNVKGEYVVLRMYIY